MAAPRVERRLTAVLAAGIVGYSRLMERDEPGTHERVQVLRKQLIEPLIAEHRGLTSRVSTDRETARNIMTMLQCAQSLTAHVDLLLVIDLEAAPAPRSAQPVGYL
jgi:class 3 adenylate cyclase